MTIERIRRFTSRTAAAILSLGVGLAAGRAAQASPVAEAIIAEVQAASYQHYLEDLLYTHLGDNRGFGPQHDLARDNILTTLGSFGITVNREPFVYNSVTYHNLVGTQVGTESPGEIIVLGAHFDSVNNPGADDNGTGTALVMEAARVLSRHRAARTIKYVLFDREEQGRRGSIAFVAAHAAENILMAVTMDMVGHDSGAYAMDLYSKSTSAGVTNGVASAIDVYGGALGRFINFGNYTFSDHWSFESAGVPAVVIIERCYTCNTHYHQSTDAVDLYQGYISYPLVTDLTRSVVGYLVDAVGVAPWGDADEDGDIDPADLAAYEICFGSPAAPDCHAFDFNRSGAIDCADWPGFRAAFEDSSRYTPTPPVAVFTDVLIGVDADPAHACMSDLTGDGTVNAADIQPYVDAQ